MMKRLHPRFLNHSLARMLAVLLALGWISLSQPSHAQCFELAEQHYGVSAALLRAVAEQESSMNPLAFHRNTNGSWDAGLMQINSRWLPLLKRHGIEAHDLLDGCTSVLIGAWILANNFRRMGKTTQALGAYNAANPQIRERYARQVLSKLDRVKRTSQLQLQ